MAATAPPKANSADPVECLRALVEKHGTQKRVAGRLGVSRSYLADILNGRKPPGQRILAKLGFRQVKVYERR